MIFQLISHWYFTVIPASRVERDSSIVNDLLTTHSLCTFPLSFSHYIVKVHLIKKTTENNLKNTMTEDGC